VSGSRSGSPLLLAGVLLLASAGACVPRATHRDDDRSPFEGDPRTDRPSTPSAAPASHEAEQIVAIAREELERDRLPGMAIAVARTGTVVVDEGLGWADLESSIPATAGDVFQLGSIGKQFTAAGVMLLVERGAVSLEAPIATYLRRAPPAWRDVRVRHLLQHSSGLREFITLPPFQRGASDVTRPSSELVDLIAAEPLGFRPGDRWSYSNSNYTLLAAILEQVTGKPYEVFLDEELFTPLGLDSLHHCPSVPPSATDDRPESRAPRYATGYVVDGGRWWRSPPENMSWARGDGGLCGTARDLVRWIRALAQGRALSEDSYRRMIASEPTADGITPAYGFGLSLVPLDDRIARIGHHGAMAGFTAMLDYYPADDLAIAVLVNRGGATPEVLAKRLARSLLGLPPRVAPEPGSHPDVGAPSFTGTWDIGITSFPIRVVEGSSGLRIEMPPPGTSDDLVPLGGDRFAAASAPDALEVWFERGASGRAEAMRLSMAELHWYGRRVLEER
jgi:CubicO group peptidase (beta-lactamase class C family)